MDETFGLWCHIRGIELIASRLYRDGDFLGRDRIDSKASRSHPQISSSCGSLATGVGKKFAK